MEYRLHYARNKNPAQERAAGAKKTALFDIVNREWRAAHRPTDRSGARAATATRTAPAERATKRARSARTLRSPPDGGAF
jgi:hypothetical protein